MCGSKKSVKEEEGYGDCHQRGEDEGAAIPRTADDDELGLGGRLAARAASGSGSREGAGGGTGGDGGGGGVGGDWDGGVEGESAGGVGVGGEVLVLQRVEAVEHPNRSRDRGREEAVARISGREGAGRRGEEGHGERAGEKLGSSESEEGEPGTEKKQRRGGGEDELEERRWSFCRLNSTRPRPMKVVKLF